ncbi:MAG: SDR family NAD(P)-dependent oxidoreductase [Erythrobacter sp.]|nr:SDR family NAD(P)-dependent oxidoreductase [Erythrobacter sp.]
MSTILITGSTDGIGLETAKRLAASGHRLLLHGRNAEKLERARAETENAHSGAKVETYLADFSRLSEVVAIADEIRQRHDQLKVLINNAGIFKVSEPILETGHDMRFVVNTFAVEALTKALLPIIPNDGRVISLSSSAQSPVDMDLLRGRKTTSRAMDAYAQSKLALTMWSRAMALAHPDGPVFVAVNPGSMLGSKMVREGFGVSGGDLAIGAEILVRAALSEEFRMSSGRYFDNDRGTWGAPHPEAMDDTKVLQMAEWIERIARSLA